MKSLTKLKELVVEKVSLPDVLKSYGANFIYNPDLAEEAQYSCPVHGDDRKPSARYYAATKSCYCWACHKSWDVIRLVMDKEGMNFRAAVLHLVSKYRIDTSTIPDAPDLPKVELPKNIQILIANSDAIYLRKKVREFKNILPLEKYALLCSAYYMVMHDKSKGLDVAHSMKKLEHKIRKLTYA